MTKEEKYSIAKWAMEHALKSGAQQASVTFEVACAGLELTRRVYGSRAHLVCRQLVQQLVAPTKHTHMRAEILVLWDKITINPSHLEHLWN